MGKRAKQRRSRVPLLAGANLEPTITPDTWGVLSTVHPFWQEVLVDASRYGVVSVDWTDERHVSFGFKPADHAMSCPRADVFQSAAGGVRERNGEYLFGDYERRRPGCTWYQNIAGARARGWDWSGDTDVWVYRMPGGVSFREACTGCVVGLAKGMAISGLQIDRHQPPTSCYTFRSWRDFFDYGIRYEHDCSVPKGHPLRTTTLINDGNLQVLVGGAANRYWVIVYLTS